MIVVYPMELIEACQKSKDKWGVLVGKVLDSDVYALQGTRPAHKRERSDQSYLGIWTRTARAGQEAAAPGPVALVLTDAGPDFRQRRPDGTLAERVQGTIVISRASLFRRLQGVVDVERLSSSKVVIIGCGSQGSWVAWLLVCAGVCLLALVDPQRLDPHNVIRHVCNLHDVGRLKVPALAERLKEKNPNLQIETLPLDVCQDQERLQDIVAGADLVIGATDSPRAQMVINSAAVAAGKPAIYPGVYNACFGGEVIRVIPGQTPCLRCIYDATADIFNRVEPGDDGQTRPYDEDRGHPGMWIDAGFIAHLAARMAVETLLAQTDPTMNLTEHYLLWGNRRWWIFGHPLDHQSLTVARRETCLVCGGAAALDALLQQHDLDRVTARQLAESAGAALETGQDLAGLLAGE